MNEQGHILQQDEPTEIYLVAYNNHVRNHKDTITRLAPKQKICVVASSKLVDKNFRLNMKHSPWTEISGFLNISINNKLIHQTMLSGITTA